jgi:hypothetical protein
MFSRNDSEILGLALEALCNITSAEMHPQQGRFLACLVPGIGLAICLQGPSASITFSC